MRAVSIRSGLFALLLLGSNIALLAQSTPSSHVGRDLPEYVTGDECLFCHRNDVGPSWKVNAHQQTMRPLVAVPEIAKVIHATPELEPHAQHIRFILGSKSQHRLLKKGSGYGQLEMLTGSLRPDEVAESLIFHEPETLRWEEKTFGQSCAGCHATAVDSRYQSISATAIDCYSCHGVVDLKHSKDTSLVYLSKKRNDPPTLIAAACGQCHIRTGRSKTSGLPYANNYVVGDDLFSDFQVNLSPDALTKPPPRERHILENIKAMNENDSSITCLTCHDIHRASGRKHRRVTKTEYCYTCHQPDDMKLTYNRKIKHHTLCGY